MKYNIKQFELNEVEDFEYNQKPNKIKEKEESLKNTLNNIVNIPYGNIIDVTKENNKGYEIDTPNYLEVVAGKRGKPINLRNFMLENVINQAIVRDKKNLKINEDEKINELATKEIEIEEPTVKTNNSTIQDKINELDEVKNKNFEIKDKASKIRAELEESDKNVQETSMKLTEFEKRYQELEEISMQNEKRILEALERQKQLLEQEMNENSQLIKDADKIKKENETKIIEFNSKIDSTIKKTDLINEKISRQEQILKSLGYNNEDHDEIRVRVA